jgi:XapX domain-containing protein
LLNAEVRAIELAVDAAYGLVQVRSPAPPMIALVGLFGMVLGQEAVDIAKRRFMPAPSLRPALFEAMTSKRFELKRLAPFPCNAGAIGRDSINSNLVVL